ncbi:MAG: FkbM family methyltransferase [Pseudomonadota bacterium]
MYDPNDRAEQSFRGAFTAACRARTVNYEHVIEAVYRRDSVNWAPGYVVDGGAHKGLHTLPLATLAPVETVLAFEPGEEAHAVLVKRIASDPNRAKIRLIKAAIQDDPGRDTVTFHVSTNHPGRSGINPILRRNRDTHSLDPLEVPATTLDQSVAGLEGRCGFIKLDLEGGEFNALKGARDLLRRDKPLILFENGRHAPEIGGYTRGGFLRFLDRMGLVVITAFGDVGTPRNMRDFWYAWACAKRHEARTRRMVRMEAGRCFRAFRAAQVS